MIRIKTIESYLKESKEYPSSFRGAIDMVTEDFTKFGISTNTDNKSEKSINSTQDSISVTLKSIDLEGLSSREMDDEISRIYKDNTKSKVRDSGTIELEISPSIMGLLQTSSYGILVSLYKKTGGISLYGLESISNEGSDMHLVFWNRDKFVNVEFELIDSDTSDQMAYDESFTNIYESHKSSDGKKYEMYASFSGHPNTDSDFEEIIDINEI
jgi:hypothetical protein